MLILFLSTPYSDKVRLEQIKEQLFQRLAESGEKDRCALAAGNVPASILIHNLGFDYTYVSTSNPYGLASCLFGCCLFEPGPFFCVW
jgi:hypothetical protein